MTGRQVRAVTEDGSESIRRAGLRPTHTPAVLITRGRIDQQLGVPPRPLPVPSARRPPGSTNRCRHADRLEGAVEHASGGGNGSRSLIVPHPWLSQCPFRGRTATRR
ncbi:DUF5958 family protein [Streptomyces sp. NPDC048275]|uniref:DUF5958 family protein n=1 Tax=Streptomyces sp. NPDC048275 TaxID=3155629 RepID=UPI0033D5ED9E